MASPTDRRPSRLRAGAARAARVAVREPGRAKRAGSRVVLSVVAGLMLLPGAAARAQPDPVAVGRPVPIALSPLEYNHTIADLLGLPRDGAAWPERPALAETLSPRRAASRGVFVPPPPPPPWPWPFPEEPGANGFDGIARGQAASSAQIEALHLAAMHFASFAMVSPTFFRCDDWPALGDDARAACAWASLERFAERAYRRPLDPDERARLRRFWLAAAERGPMDEAVALAVAGILQTPAFQFRIERGGRRPPTGWEIASRLSYFLWDSMPDDALFDAARTGRLGTAADLGREARRMLDHPHARAAVVRFHHRWLGTEDVLLVAPARRAYGPLFGLAPALKDASDDDLEWPAVMGPVRHSMKLETELFVERTIFDGDGTFEALMTDHHGYMSEATAPIYGPGARRLLDGPPVTRSIAMMVASIGREQTLTLYPTAFPPDERAGVLTLPAVLALGAYAVQPGPILRGKRVLERLACTHLGPPIQGAEAALPPDTLTAERTNRERTAAATRPPTCDACHRHLNPPGFAFEHYDAIGRWRAEDNGQPVDASGSLTLGDDEEIVFRDGVELARRLAASPRVKDCYVLHWTRAALGRQIDAAMPGLPALQARFRNDDSVTELLVAIASSELFRAAWPPPADGVNR